MVYPERVFLCHHSACNQGTNARPKWLAIADTNNPTTEKSATSVMLLSIIEREIAVTRAVICELLVWMETRFRSLRFSEDVAPVCDWFHMGFK